MNETELIEFLVSRWSDAFDVPVQAGVVTDDRPVPLVFIEDWDTTEQTHHNSAYAGDTFADLDGDDTKEYEWYLNFEAATRVEVQIRHDDKLGASHLKEQLKSDIRLMGENPLRTHDALKRVEIRTEGNPTYQLIKPTEYHLVVAARFFYDDTVTRTPDDVPEDVIRSISEDYDTQS